MKAYYFIVLLVMYLLPVTTFSQWPTSPNSLYIPEVGSFPDGATATIFLPKPDDNGGFYFSHTGSVYGLQHMGSNGELLWGETGVNLPPNDYGQTTIADLEPTEDGSLYVLYENLDVWWDEVYHYRPYLFLALFNSGGGLVWEEAFQVAADSAHGGLIEWLPADLIRDPTNQGIFVHWREADSTSPLFKDKFQYIKNIDASPVEQYTQYGVRLDDPESGIPQIQRSEVKGIFINDDLGFDVFVTAGDTILYFQKYNSDAIPLLSNPGVVVAPETFNFPYSTVRPQRYTEDHYIVTKGGKLQITDNYGNAILSPQQVAEIGTVARAIPAVNSETSDFITWTARQDSVTEEFVLYYQWFDSDLNKHYGPDGMMVDTLDGFNWGHPYYLQGPELSVYVCRTFPNDGRLYTQRFNRQGQLWDDWELVNENDWYSSSMGWTYAFVVSDGALIVPMYNGEEWGLVRMRPSGELGGPITGVVQSYYQQNKRALGTPYPNPFNARIKIPIYNVGTHEGVIGIYDLSGRMVRQLNIGHGTSVFWDGKDAVGRNVSSGVYFVCYTLNSNLVTPGTTKIVLTR